MADGIFSTGLSDPRAAGAEVVAPVASTNYGQVFETIGDIGKIFALTQKNDAKKKEEERKNSTLGNYVSEFDKLESLKASGAINDQVYGVRSRSLFRQYSASFPEYLDDFKKASTGLKEFGGLGDVMDNEQYKKQERRNAVADAAKYGIDVSMNDSPEYQDAAIKQHREILRVTREAEERRKLRAEVREEESFVMKRKEFVDEQNAQEGVQQLGKAGLPVLNELSNQIASEWGKPGVDQNLLMTRWDANINNWKANIAATAGKYGAASAGWNAIVDQIDKSFKDRISGKVPTETAKNNATRLMDIATSGILADPAVADGFARLKLAPNAMDSLLNYTKDKTVLSRMFGVMTSEKAPVDMNKKEDLQALARSYKEIVADATLDPVEKGKVRANVTNNLLVGLSNSMTAGSDPNALRDAIGIIKSPTFLEDLKSGKINQTAYNAAKHAVNSQYNQPVTTQLTSKFKEPMSVFGGRTALDVFDIQVGPDGLKLAPKLQFFGSPDLVMGVSQIAASEKALNDLIIANAHMSGTNDYQKYWEENKGILFPNVWIHPSVLKKGDVVDGKEYTGGVATDPASWIPVENKKAFKEGKIGGPASIEPDVLNIPSTNKKAFKEGKVGGMPSTEPQVKVGKVGGAPSTTQQTSVGVIQ